MRSFLVVAASVSLVASALSGCASTGESAEADRLTANVGNFGPPPGGVEKPRVGIPAFSVQAQGSLQGKSAELDALASDQMTTLIHMTRRFDAIERGQLQQLVDEQNLEGIVKAGELARPGQVRGVDYLLLGKVTNFRMKSDRTGSGVDVGGGVVSRVSGGWLSGSTGFDRKESRIVTECGVDIRLVNPTTGKIEAAHFGEFKRTDTAGALGINVLGVSSSAEAEVQVGVDDAGKVLRLAFDEALKKMLPEVDNLLMRSHRAGAAPPVAGGAPAAAPAAVPAAVPGSTAPSTPASTPAAGAKKFCGQCGGQLAGAAKFCGGCGAKIE